ncbi:MAG: thermonuclease family protein [Candidatus Omnitrophica bacterium]|nr:thermonuclease family protein [Candidatus Omnitrophota bacterium]
MIQYLLVIFCLMVFPVMTSHAEELINLSTSKFKEALVVKVNTSDIIILEDGQRIKLLGIESFGPPPVPKVTYDQKGHPIEDKEVEPTIPLEEQAIAFAQNLLEGKKVKLEFDVDSRDEKGYKTAYVYLPDGKMANVEILRQGFVRMKIRPPNVKHEDLFKLAYQEARKEQRGFLSY